MARRSQPAWAVLFAALQAGHETGHDDDGQHLHRPLRGDGKKVIAIVRLILAKSGSGWRN